MPQHLQDGTPSAGDAAALGHGEGYVHHPEPPDYQLGQRKLSAARLGTYRGQGFWAYCGSSFLQVGSGLVSQLPTWSVSVLSSQYWS